jgi:hypothetical protein
MKPDVKELLQFGGESGSGKRHFNTTVVKTQEDENSILNTISKAVNDIKSEVGSIKKMVQPPPTRRGMPRNQFSRKDGAPANKMLSQKRRRDS